MVSTLDIPAASIDVDSLPLGQLLAVPYDQLKFEGNSRYGWEQDSILDAYLPAVLELKDLILYGGFKPNFPIEVYKKNGELYRKDGNRRWYAVKTLIDEDPDTETIDGYPPGYVYIVIVAPPASMSEMLLEQSFSNTSVPSTPLDIAKVYAARFEEIRATGLKETDALKALEAELVKKTGKSPKPATLRQSIKLLNLPAPVLHWLQASFLDATPIKISVKMISTVVTVYGDKPHQSHKLLTTAAELIKTDTKNIEANGTFQGFITAAWLDSLAVDLDIPVINAASARSNTAKKSASASTGAQSSSSTTSSNTQNAGTETENDDDLSDDETTGSNTATGASTAQTTTAQPTDNGAAPTRNRRPTTKESAAAGILKVFGTTDFGLHIAEDRYDSALIVETPAGTKTYTLQIEGLSQEMVADWEKLKEHIKAYLGDQQPETTTTATATSEESEEETETEF